MLQKMRKYSRSWVSAVFLVGLGGSFALWGVAGWFTGVGDNSVAVVGDSKISIDQYRQEYQKVTRSQTGPDGQPITPEEARAKQLPQQTLQMLVTRLALDREAARLGLTTGDDTVVARAQANQAFVGPTGKFDHDVFLRVIERMGYTEDSFIAALRGDETRNQMRFAAVGGFNAPPGYAQAILSYINERRAVDYVVLAPDMAGALPAPTDDQLRAVMKQHAGRFSTPEYRNFVYVAITPADVMKSVSVAESEIRREYDFRKASYVVAEVRQIDQIRFDSDGAARDARAKIAAGQSFDDLAVVRGLRAKDLTLGNVVQADMQEGGKEVFALPEGGVSQPVKNSFGWYLYRVGKITPGSTKTFEQVHDALRDEIAAKYAAAKIDELLNALDDARSARNSLEGAAAKVGLTAVSVAAMDARGNTPSGAPAAVPADPDFRAQVFAAEIGEESDAFRAKDGSAYVVDVRGATPPRLRALNEARLDATAWWSAGEVQRILNAKAAAIARAATLVHNLGGPAAQAKLTLQKSPALRRETAQPPLSQALVAKIFAAPPGGAVYGPGTGNTVIVASVTGIAHPPPASLQEARADLRAVSEQLGGDIDRSFAMAARNAQGVKVNDAAVAAAMGDGS